jgi:hypothetical protein
MIRLFACARFAGAALVALALAVAALGGSTSAMAQDATCQTPFRVFTDPANPGTQTVRGPITFVRDSGILGTYGGDGRFAGFAIDGLQDLTINGATNRVRVRGGFTATSPDGGSTFFVRYTGEVDLATGAATGHFVAKDGTGALAGFHAVGTIQAQLVGPATFDGVDIGLC